MAFQWTGQASNTDINPDIQERIQRLAALAGNTNLYGTSGRRNWGTNSHHESGNALDIYGGSSEDAPEWNDPAQRTAMTNKISPLAQQVGLGLYDEGDHWHMYPSEKGVVPGGSSQTTPQPSTPQQYGQQNAPALAKAIFDKYNAQKMTPDYGDSAALNLKMMIAGGQGLRGSDMPKIAPYAQQLSNAHAMQQKATADRYNEELDMSRQAELVGQLGKLNGEEKMLFTGMFPKQLGPVMNMMQQQENFNTNKSFQQQSMANTQQHQAAQLDLQKRGLDIQQQNANTKATPKETNPKAIDWADKKMEAIKKMLESQENPQAVIASAKNQQPDIEKMKQIDPMYEQLFQDMVGEVLDKYRNKK